MKKYYKDYEVIQIELEDANIYEQDSEELTKEEFDAQIESHKKYEDETIDKVILLDVLHFYEMENDKIIDEFYFLA